MTLIRFFILIKGQKNLVMTATYLFAKVNQHWVETLYSIQLQLKKKPTLLLKAYPMFDEA